MNHMLTNFLSHKNFRRQLRSKVPPTKVRILSNNPKILKSKPKTSSLSWHKYKLSSNNSNSSCNNSTNNSNSRNSSNNNRKIKRRLKKS